MTGVSAAVQLVPWRRIIRYLMASGLSFVISMGLTALLHEVAGLVEPAAVGIALFTAFLVNFFTLRRFVFGSTDRPGPQLIRFVFVSVAYRLSEWGAFYLIHTMVGINYNITLGSILVVTFILKYFTARFFVFAPARTTSET